MKTIKSARTDVIWGNKVPDQVLWSNGVFYGDVIRNNMVYCEMFWRINVLYDNVLGCYGLLVREKCDIKWERRQYTMMSWGNKVLFQVACRLTTCFYDVIVCN